MQLKKTLQALYVLIIAVMAMGTVVGKYAGQADAADHVFGSWWFCLLWAVGLAVAVAYFVRQKVRRPVLVVLHLSFAVILLGAFLTHVTARRGMIHLRQGQWVASYITKDGAEKPLPFTIRLDKFSISYHAGNTAAMDYTSEVTLNDDGNETHCRISMNKIYDNYGIRLYQSSFDDDLKGSYLSVNADPFGIPVTYLGYALLFIGLIGMLIDRQGTFRRLLKSDLMARPTVALLLLMSAFSSLKAQPALPKATAEAFGKAFIVYNGRICPVETFAIDFTKKLYGKAHYKDFTPCQVLTGFMFWRNEWLQEPVLRLKGSELRTRFQLDEYVAPMRLFGQQGYILGPYLQDAQENQDAFARQVLDIDDKMALLMDLAQGRTLKMFPYAQRNGRVDWFAPADRLPRSIPKAQQQYVRSIIGLAGELAVQGKIDMLNDLFQRLRKYQYRFGGSTVPSQTKVWAEKVYNHVPFATLLFIFNLTLGLVSIGFLTRRKGYACFAWLMALSWSVLTFTLALRWIISGTVPIGNGYETMLFLAWLVMLLSMPIMRRIRLMTTFGLLMSGFMLLVSHIGQMDPAITPRMPVLNSPLLSLHVSIIMIAYALFSLTFVSAVAYFLTARSQRPQVAKVNAQLTGLSQLFLYPAVTTLGLGIFIGAVWANISWGTYWSWDPKETWALITFMVYAVPLHAQSLPALRRPMGYHLYTLLAFLSIIMTYFGVNYVLGGMHSYA